MTYALDTNIVSYILRSDLNVQAKLKAAKKRGDAVMIPPVVYYEIRRGFLRKSAPVKEKAFKLFCEENPVGEMNLEAWERAAFIYAQAARTIDDADILIAAFCIAHGYTLVTNNERHFNVIGGLRIENWAACT